MHNHEKREEKEAECTVARRKLKYHIHDPNPADVSAEYILRVLIESNQHKVERALQAASKTVSSNPKEEVHPA